VESAARPKPGGRGDRTLRPQWSHVANTCIDHDSGGQVRSSVSSKSSVRPVFKLLSREATALLQRLTIQGPGSLLGRRSRTEVRADLGQGGEGNRMPTRAIPKSQLARTCGVRAVGRSRGMRCMVDNSIITFLNVRRPTISLQMKALKLSCCAGVLDSCASKPVRRPTRRNGSAVPTQADCLNQDDC